MEPNLAGVDSILQNFFAETHGAALLSVYLPRSDHGMGRGIGQVVSVLAF